MKNENYKNDYIFEWTLMEEQNKNEATNDDSLLYEEEKNHTDDNNYYIKRNKIYFHNFEEPEINCSSACYIFQFFYKYLRIIIEYFFFNIMKILLFLIYFII